MLEQKHNTEKQQAVQDVESKSDMRQGCVVRSNIVRPDGFRTVLLYQYDLRGDRVAEYLQTYTPSGVMVSEKKEGYDPNGTLVQSRVRQYNDYAQLLEETTYRHEGRHPVIDRAISYTYHNSGRVQRMSVSMYESGLLSKQSSYFYDSQGNIVRQTFFECVPGKPTFVTQQTAYDYNQNHCLVGQTKRWFDEKTQRSCEVCCRYDEAGKKITENIVWYDLNNAKISEVSKTFGEAMTQKSIVSKSDAGRSKSSKIVNKMNGVFHHLQNKLQFFVRSGR